MVFHKIPQINLNPKKKKFTDRSSSNTQLTLNQSMSLRATITEFTKPSDNDG